MLARLDTAVIAEKPDLVLWQVGTNSVLRIARCCRTPPSCTRAGAAEGDRRRYRADRSAICAEGDRQAERRGHGRSLIATAAKAEHVCLFHRFAVMRHWREVEHLPFEAFVSADGLHMNDWSYACVAKWLSVAIAEAATRPTATAGGPAGVR